MGASYLRLNIQICGMNERNRDIINKLFPQTLQNNQKLQRIEKDNNLWYTARKFPFENNSNTLKHYINENFDKIEIHKKSIANNVVLYFSDENQTLEQNSVEWKRLADNLNTLAELKLPFIIFLSYGEIDEIRNLVYQENGDIFGDFKDKRKITILNLLPNENEVNKCKNYRKILSYLWEITLILNQKPFIESKNPEANLYRKRQIEEPIATIKLLLTGFSRKGKSTFLNMAFDKMVTLENPSFIPVTTEIIEFLLQTLSNGDIITKGGLKLFDVPGIIEGTTENMKNIQNLISQSIENEALSHDVINYILFFLSPAPNFNRTSDFLRILNESGIKVIFIINRDRPRNNGMPNTN